MTKSKMTLVLPGSLQNEFRLRVINDGYGMRGKSLWVSEAIERLIEISDYPELVYHNGEMTGLDKTETIVIDFKTKQLLDQAVVHVRQCFPTVEGVRSRLVRTALLQRLLRSPISLQ